MTFEDRESKALAVIRSVEGQRSAVSFSGGKDSLVVLDLAIRAGIRRFVFCDTTITFKQTLEYVKKIEWFYGIVIEVVRAPKNFFELLQVLGPPSRRLRWCCDVFKFAPVYKYAVREGIKAFIRGTRRAESHKRSNYYYIDDNPYVPVLQVNPILEWSEKDVWSYITEYSLPANPLYELGFKRLGCWACPFKSKTEWKLTERFFPELTEKLRKALLKYAEKAKIKDKWDFVDRRGWTKWITPQVKIHSGSLEMIDETHQDDSDFLIKLSKSSHVDEVLRLLPILSRDYKLLGERELLVHIRKRMDKKLRILVEKAINCVSCGACTLMCKFNAISIKEGTPTVDTTRCTRCLDCLKCHPFRGACIARNYAPIKLDVKLARTCSKLAHPKLNAMEKEEYIQRRWREAWSSSVGKISVGLFSPCQAQRGQVDVIFNGQSEKQIERITKILPIITEDYFSVGNKLRITVKNLDRRRFNDLVSIAINCKACGACTYLCRTGALQVDKESIYVDLAKCTKCQKCIITRPLKGACVIKNYPPKIALITEA